MGLEHATHRTAYVQLYLYRSSIDVCQGTLYEFTIESEQARPRFTLSDTASPDKALNVHHDFRNFANSVHGAARAR